MDLAMDVYIPEDYVRRRYKPNMSTQKRDGRVSFDDIEAAAEKKFQLPAGDKNMMISASTSHSRSSSFKEDILFNYFNP
jgi:hypothetical protein